MTEKLEVDPKVYYQAATNCFDAAAALNDSFKYVFAELNSCGQMAGRDEDGRAWAASYDESARETVSFFDQTFSTLRAYGTALNDLGFEHAKSDAALKGTAQPDRPADAPSTLTFGPYALPASAAGGTPQGLAKTSIEVLDAINCPLPDGNTDTLAKAADAWDRLGTIYQNTNAKDKITISASLFDGVTSKDAIQVREDLKTLETSIGALLDTCKQISKTCLDYKQSIEELRNEIKGFIEAIIQEAAINVAVTVVATCLTGVGGLIAGAKAVESARRWAVKIKATVTAWRARKALQLKGLADDAKAAMAKAKQAVKDLLDRLGRKGDGSGMSGSRWEEISGMLRDAAKGKGNFGIGSGTAEEAEAAGRAWVGPNATLASDGKTLVSEDGLRQFRPPSFKPNLGRYQANFEWRNVANGRWQGNGHLDVTDMP
ncbi:hypothetical protein ACFYV7_19610 [Nocardia suismassiliense]|uniref:Outer membrane channel protein CpnT-like N-terminal domain-containing protein n=1 Tax=Nocardia suismassiliense TaxID=2077092 RepID=A0ABW6QV45_9NOCA